MHAVQVMALVQSLWMPALWFDLAVAVTPVIGLAGAGVMLRTGPPMGMVRV